MHAFQHFFKQESASAVILLTVALAAMVLANSPLAVNYFSFLHLHTAATWTGLDLPHTVAHWVNDGLMAVFFLLVGLEIKRELLVGELSSLKKASLPLISALGGMVCPALIYAALNYRTPYSSGWGIPMATDIAFALGVLATLGSRVSPYLKVFLAALAIADDLGAILVIALFYTSGLSALALVLAAGILAIMAAANAGGVRRLSVYLPLGAVLWYCVFHSGVHATIAGVLTAACIPILGDDDSRSPLLRLEHALHPWVAFVIMPIFAFANAGVALGSAGHEGLFSSMPLGIFLGLFAGKLSGIFGFAYASTKIGLAVLPTGIRWREVFGVAALGGIGFTMSLFIAALALPDPQTLDTAKLAVLAASAVSGTVGYLVLRLSPKVG